jgi:hypothetical protein
VTSAFCAAADALPADESQAPCATERASSTAAQTPFVASSLRRSVAFLPIKSPSRYADPPNMSAGSLPTDAWVCIGLIAGLAVLQCLGILANVLRYELGMQKVVREVRALRKAVFGLAGSGRSRPTVTTIKPEPELRVAPKEKKAA